MPKIYPDRLDTLIVVSEGQDGFFTTEQAREAGVSLPALAGLQHAGHLEREQYGVYRLARWPASGRPGLWRVYLWATRTDARATFSHRTAMELHAVSDLNPTKIDVTFPPGVRVRATKPPAVVIHQRAFSDDDVEDHDGFRVTTLYRTLLDLAADGLGREAIADVLDRGNSVDLSPSQVRQLRAVYDLSEDTRQYLAHALTKARRTTRRR